MGVDNTVGSEAEPVSPASLRPQAWHRLRRLIAGSLPMGRRPLVADCHSATFSVEMREKQRRSKLAAPQVPGL